MNRNNRLLPIACLLLVISIILPKAFEPTGLIDFIEGFLQGISLAFFGVMTIFGTQGFEKVCAFKKRILKADA